jgi:hypothetical protein
MNRGLPSIVLLSALSIAAVTAACGDDAEVVDTRPPGSTEPAPAPQPNADGPVLIYEATGGCQMMGPNCPRFEVYADGTVEIFRAGENEPAEATGSVDAAAVAAFFAVADVEAADFDTFVGGLGEGTCQACLDGVDIQLDVKLNGASESLNSSVVSFDPGEPFFAALDTLMAKVFTVGELAVEQR